MGRDCSCVSLSCPGCEKSAVVCPALFLILEEHRFWMVGGAAAVVRSTLVRAKADDNGRADHVFECRTGSQTELPERVQDVSSAGTFG